MLKVGAGNCLVSVARDVLPSFLPFGTFQLGPPDYRINYTIRKCKHFFFFEVIIFFFISFTFCEKKYLRLYCSKFLVLLAYLHNSISCC